jgi:hypothetical protein
MTDVQLRVLLSHLKARLDDAIDIAEDKLPEELKVTPQHPELLKAFEPLLQKPQPYIPQLAELYALQQALAEDIERLDAATPDNRRKSLTS